MDYSILGKCRHGVYAKESDPCYYCALCSIDGNDYSDFKSGKPSISKIFNDL